MLNISTNVKDIKSNDVSRQILPSLSNVLFVVRGTSKIYSSIPRIKTHLLNNHRKISEYKEL